MSLPPLRFNPISDRSITLRTSVPTDYTTIADLYSYIARNGGFPLANPEFNREISALDWEDWIMAFNMDSYVYERRGLFQGFVGALWEDGIHDAIHFGIQTNELRPEHAQHFLDITRTAGGTHARLSTHVLGDNSLRAMTAMADYFNADLIDGDWTKAV